MVTVVSRAVLLLAIANGTASKPAMAEAVLGGVVTHVRDGDTIEVGGIAVRLNGLHAPELNEAGGLAARMFMVRLVAGKQVRCVLDGTRTHDRVVGICTLNGSDIARALVRAGLGRDCPRFSRGQYRADETAAGRRLQLPGYCVPR